jgi:ubiquinone/menaquinone biosynthesis C-methylase UbiE
MPFTTERFTTPMLPRVLEPEVMDSAEEAVDYDAMDHAKVNSAFVADLLAFWQPRGSILDVGTGTAQIPIEFCRNSSNGTVVAIDAAHHMLRVAQANVDRAGHQARIQLQACDAKKMPFTDGRFDAVISNSIVHHIPEPFEVLREMARVVAPGGAVFVRDLLRPQDEATLKHLIKTYAGDANLNQQKMFGDSLKAALTLEEVREMVHRLGFDRQAVRQNSDRHWTWSCAKPKLTAG